MNVLDCTEAILPISENCSQLHFSFSRAHRRTGIPIKSRAQIAPELSKRTIKTVGHRLSFNLQNLKFRGSFCGPEMVLKGCLIAAL